MEQVFVLAQLPHARIENSPLYHHFHWTYIPPKAAGDVGDLNFGLGGNASTYMTLIPGDIEFNPYLQKYGLYGKLYNDVFELYASHQCDHPVRNEQELTIYDKDTDTNYYVNNGGNTMFGIRLKW